MLSPRQDIPDGALIPSTFQMLVVFEPYQEKTCFDICEQQRRRSACASAQSDQCLCYFVIHCIDSIIPLVCIPKILNF